MTNCIGGPPVEPGSAGGEKACTCACGTAEEFRAERGQHLLLASRALVPGLEEQAGEGVADAGGAVDGEDVRDLGHPAHAVDTGACVACSI